MFTMVARYFDLFFNPNPNRLTCILFLKKISLYGMITDQDILQNTARRACCYHNT